MMEAPKNVALLIDAIVFLQNNVSLGMLLHPSEDILVRNPALSLFKLLFELIEAPVIAMYVRADVEWHINSR